MDEEKVLAKLAEDAWWLYTTTTRLAKDIRTDKNALKKSKNIKRLNSKIANIMIDIDNVVEADILSNESIESMIIAKQEKINNELEKGEN